MIRYLRDKVERPEALDKKYSSRSKPPKIPDKTETESVLVAFEAHEAAAGDPIDFSFKFERYKEKEVRERLRELFKGKCAYCESVYVGTQPMDVEHWRPKSEVHEGKTKLPGYFWLAAEWSNLYPSCIDCNRSRTQVDAVTKEELALGKANQFPVKDGVRLASPGDDPTVENPLLVDPCQEDPEPLFTYTEKGFILPAVDQGLDHDKALESIRVYALNRADLVAERLALRTLVDHRLELISELGLIRQALRVPPTDPLFQALSDLISMEADRLLAMMEDDQPYAGMVREMIRDADPLPT